MLKPRCCLVSVIVVRFRTCSVVLLPTQKPHCSSTKMLLLSNHSHKTLFRIFAKIIYGVDNKDIPLYCSGLLGSFMEVLGRGTIVVIFQAVGIHKLFTIDINIEVRKLTQISFRLHRGFHQDQMSFQFSGFG